VTTNLRDYILSYASSVHVTVSFCKTVGVFSTLMPPCLVHLCVLLKYWVKTFDSLGKVELIWTVCIHLN
jgi:hypothetical protein